MIRTQPAASSTASPLITPWANRSREFNTESRGRLPSGSARTRDNEDHKKQSARTPHRLPRPCAVAGRSAPMIDGPRLIGIVNVLAQGPEQLSIPRMKKRKRLILAFVCLMCVSLSCNGLRVTRDHHRISKFSPEEAEQRGLIAVPFIDRRADPEDDLVQLVQRRSLVAPWIAVHPLFRTYDHSADRWDEWDVYAFWGLAYREEVHTIRAPSADGLSVEETAWITRRWGTIDKTENLTFIFKDGLVTGEWHGEDARTILEVLSRPEDYPHIETYNYWPGPNSKTYVAWVLRQSGLRVDHHPLAIGKDYVGLWGFGAWTTTTGTGVQIESPIVGLKLGLMDGLEVHVLCLTLGIDLWPPALKTPLGRFGMAE
ncbi:MAG: hypothetical protein ACI8QS_002989 [Planctomycetota bacterium]